MSKKSEGRIWPYAIVLSILFIIGASVMTVVVAVENPVQMSDTCMQDYHHYDANANSFIEAKIAFDKKYIISYASDKLDKEHAVVVYRVTDKEGNEVNDAKINIVLTRPDNRDSDIELGTPSVAAGVYTFDVGTLPLAGRWNIMANVLVGDNQRYYNLKADTRYPNAFEY